MVSILKVYVLGRGSKKCFPNPGAYIFDNKSPTNDHITSIRDGFFVNFLSKRPILKLMKHITFGDFAKCSKLSYISRV